MNAEKKELAVEPLVALRVNGKRFTTHQLDVLAAVSEEGSQNRAATRLNISTPVVHRYLVQMEVKLGVPLLRTSATGTTLTEDGERIAQEYSALTRRMKLGGATVVGGTMVTEELLLSSLSRIDPQARYELIISDDPRNLKDFNAGMMDLVVLDDPLNLFELEGVMWEEIAEDRLLQVDNGPRYARFVYGAQRIGFQHLDSLGVPYKVERTYRSVSALLGSGLSFFINESLAVRKGLKLKSSTDTSLLAHRINAVFRRPSSDVTRLMKELKREGRSRL